MTGLFVRLAAGLALGLAFAPQGAQAQVFGYWGYQSFSSGVYPEDIADIVADEGLRLVGRPRLNGRVYVVQTRDGRGARFRLIISADSGEILKSFEVAARGDAEAEPPRVLPSAPLPQRRAARPEFEAEPQRIVPSAPIPQRRAARTTPDPLVIPGVGPEPAAPAIVRKPAPRPSLVRRPEPVIARPLPPPAAAAAPPSAAAPAQAAPAHAAAPQQAVAPQQAAAPLGDGPVKKPPTADVPVAPLD